MTTTRHEHQLVLPPEAVKLPVTETGVAEAEMDRDFQPQVSLHRLSSGSSTARQLGSEEVGAYKGHRGFERQGPLQRLLSRGSFAGEELHQTGICRAVFVSIRRLPSRKKRKKVEKAWRRGCGRATVCSLLLLNVLVGKQRWIVSLHFYNNMEVYVLMLKLSLIVSGLVVACCIPIRHRMDSITFWE